MNAPVTTIPADAHPAIAALVTAIIQRGMSFNEACRQCGIGTGTISRWLRGGGSADLDTLDTVAAVLGLKIIAVPDWFDADDVMRRLELAETRAAVARAPEGMGAVEVADWLRGRGYGVVAPVLSAE